MGVACASCEGGTRTTNNTATDAVVVTPSTLLTISKTNNTDTLVAGQTTTYIIVVSNLGRSAADNSRLADPAAPGLSRISVTCSSSTATCPTAPIAIASLQGGLLIPVFPPNSSLAFSVVCSVTAAGL